MLLLFQNHISRACRSKPRYMHCGGNKHSAEEVCSAKEPTKYFNYEGAHLPTSAECPQIIEHRSAQAFAAANNIPLIEAKLTSSQGKLRPSGSYFGNTDPRFDYNNFPILNKLNPQLNPTSSHKIDLQPLTISQIILILAPPPLQIHTRTFYYAQINLVPLLLHLRRDIAPPQMLLASKIPARLTY